MYIFSTEAAAPKFSDQGNLIHSISISKKIFPMCHVCVCMYVSSYWVFFEIFKMPYSPTYVKEVYDPPPKAITILYLLYVFCADY